MIEAKNVTKAFGKFKALNDVTLTIKDKESVAFIGPNASGKTTFIKSLLGLVIPEKGSFLINGNNTKGNYEYRSFIGYMPQIGRYPENMTIRQVLQLILDMRGKSFSETDNDLIDAFEMKSIFDKRMGTLSGGTRQKVSACIAFLFNPQIILLDEPTAGLDPISADILKEKINTEKNKGKLIVVTSHILSELEELVTKLVYFRDGMILFEKPLEELTAKTGEKKLGRALAAYIKQIGDV